MSFIEFNRNVDCPYCGEWNGTTLCFTDDLDPVPVLVNCFNCSKDFHAVGIVDIDAEGVEIKKKRNKK